MRQSVPTNKLIAPPDQIEARGYVIDEFADAALKDIATGLTALALICDDAEKGGAMAEISGHDWASILRVFGRQAETIHDQAVFVNRAQARPRNVH
jgi:hypothetical protein